MQSEQGFTLIEILVVILIIGIIAGIALFSFGDFGTSRQVKVTAEQLVAYIKLVQQRAILEMTTLGIHITKEGYETYRYVSNNLSNNLSHNHWQPLPKTSLIFHRSFPKDVIVVLHSTLKSTKKPNIIITPSGNMAEFKLMFGTASEPSRITIIGRHNGNLTLDTNLQNK